MVDGICSGYILTGQPIPVTPDYTETTITCGDTLSFHADPGLSLHCKPCTSLARFFGSGGRTKSPSCGRSGAQTWVVLPHDGPNCLELWLDAANMGFPPTQWP